MIKHLLILSVVISAAYTRIPVAMSLAAQTRSNTNVYNAQSTECQCLPKDGVRENSCASTGKTVDVCTAMPDCEWGPTTDATCQAEIKKFQDGILPQPKQECKCLPNTSSADMPVCSSSETVDVCEAMPNCEWGPTTNATCQAEFKKFQDGILPEKEDPKDESEDKDVTSIINELNNTWNEVKEGLLSSGIVSKEELEGLTEIAHVAIQAVESLIETFSNIEFAQ